MIKTNLVVIGGFLGAGKTTSILNMAKYLLSIEKKIGIVTNDQGSQLVDTNFLAKEGLPVLEVTGGCFCCNFDEFTQKVNQLAENEMPDIILAEPVGSCTDLIATIFKPLQLSYTRQFTLSPLSIVVDPKRVKKLMIEKNSSLFPNEINYLFRKQLEEADLIILNKIDTLSQDEINSICAFLKQEFKGVDVLTVSAKENVDIDKWAAMVIKRQSSMKNTLDIDYETYAAAEEYLGWLNSSVLLNTHQFIDMNAFIKNLMENLREKLKQQNIEIAHLKIYGIAEDDWAKASLTSIFDNVDFNRTMKKSINQANLIINARINIEPEKLKPLVEDTLRELCTEISVVISDIKTECFKPGRPQPKYRMK